MSGLTSMALINVNMPLILPPAYCPPFQGLPAISGEMGRILASMNSVIMLSNRDGCYDSATPARPLYY